MTAPSPTPGVPAPSPSPSTTVPLNPDGTPNLGGASPNPVGATTIWNIPKGLDPSKPIWFDVGKRKVNDDAISMATLKRRDLSHTSSYEIMTSPDKVMTQFAAMSKNDPNHFYQLQLALASGPFGQVNATGSFDHDTERALGYAMLQYVKLTQGAGVGISFSDYLLQAASQATKIKLDQQDQANKDKLAQQQVVTTDPNSIRQSAQSAARDALGQSLSEDQLNAFIKKFQSSQVAAQTQIGGTVSAPDLGADAASFVQKSNPEAFHQNQRTAYLDQLVNLLGGSVTSRPDQQPVANAGGTP